MLPSCGNAKNQQKMVIIAILMKLRNFDTQKKNAHSNIKIILDH